MNFISNIGVKGKLLLSFIIVIVLTCVIASVSLYNLNASQNTAERAAYTVDVIYQRLKDFNAQISDFRASVFEFHAHPHSFTKEKTAQVDEKLQKIKSSMKDIIEMSHSPATDGMSDNKQSQLLEAAINQALKTYENKMLVQLNRYEYRKASRTYVEELFPELGTAINETENYVSLVLKFISVRTNELTDKTPTYIVIITTTVAMLLSVVIAIGLSNSFIKILNSAVLSSQNLAQGDLASHIANNRKDEFGQLLIALEKMRTEWQENVKRIVTTSDSAAEKINSINEITGIINDQSKDTENRAVTVAAASDEMVSTTGDIAKNCEQAAAKANETNQITSSGVSNVERTIENIKEQANKTRIDAEKVNALSEQTIKIGSIIQSIDEIANQTNLLALNAAIEAARAGEAGKGFAVVADEVRSLAAKTGQSTQEISQMVIQVQKTAEDANSSMQSSLSNMNSLEEQTGAIQSLLEEISSHVSDVNAQITQIATAAEEQTVATSEISSNMQDITKGTEVVSGKLDSAKSAVVGAVDQLQDLTRMLSHFKV
ncbi:methyl-accepting chemotaxis protein [Succinivibrio dextrinosolvens]|uniref:methyl-accepting chemotaxis protein n=1 Tax=Succinivibrio dextrinosolvens TaxID=83771 RepID=UPI00241FD11B|nr:methyl-accepting chemotaxis protein [Succinivibrio dextrinosolvens]MBE6422442.1 methyl-accepting chemotaxis protein [Succinivibrio dextrinosolvens]